MQLSRNLLLLSCCGFTTQSLAANDDETQPLQVECIVLPPAPIVLSNPEQLEDQTIVIESKKTEIIKNQSTKFSGDVILATQDKKVTADELLIDRSNNLITTKGKTKYQDNIITINADSLNANSLEKTLIMEGTEYRLNTAPGRGAAKTLQLDPQGVTLTDSSFTSCTETIPDWELSASEINLSSEDNEGEAWNSVFRVKDIPVLYLPYFNFPLTDERKSGLLYPKISSSGSSGFKYEQPFYWNIAPNVDATITPIHMSKRGTQLNTEVRYLRGQQMGKFDIEYLEEDKELINNDDARYLTRFQHAGTFKDDFRVYADYSDLSDDNYLVDIGSSQFSKTDAYLWRIGELSYFGNNWHSTIKVQDFKVLGDSENSYKTLPQLEFDVYQPLGFFNSTFNVYSEYSHFDISNDNLPTADRFHIESGINIPYSRPGWFVNTDVRLMHTIYQQDNIETINAISDNPLEEDVTRTLPKARFHAGLTFDRDTAFFLDDMTHTFEPQIQYLYIPSKDQTDIFIYDTSPLQDDFDGLFRDTRFSGLDRIAEANQLSLGASSRILDNHNKELFRLSLGRIFYLEDSNITFDDEGERIDKSAVAADLFIQLAKRWQLQSDIQYDTKNSRTEKSQVALDYRHNNRNIFQVNHRYLRNLSNVQIEQVSLLASFPISLNWQFVGQLTQDLIRERSLESYAGLQYESCCWAVRVAYHRNINTNLDEQDFIEQNRDEFDSGFMVQFVLKGLGGSQKPLAIDDMLETGLFGYKRPYFLSN